ncbi:uncharacterized protein BT62DRAFT_998546 [Guyanagaster necrorhizus]|uniref:Uncharacterized protein n=1 Tax=Guyanagaster necrorhizus TaxID=856835 RepID=A0A9P7W758_9AGAR|nr:uncharacterized protein BT62DRAFT_998546 [Guyanagaster necrorhizus MCA 3950]KAG7452516.1 hypothetical protein BT62DRAFT_998546 [Guyanagaster necrorhizus MCA 3950]
MSGIQTYVPNSTAGLKPKRHHGYAVFLFIMGTLFPPLAVAARFGFGGDFWLNLLLTICGYIPGHGHNFYIQNIRNNKNHRRTPKWAQRYGLVDTFEIRRKERKSQWAARYNDRLPQSTLEGQPYEEGQEAGSSIDLPSEDGRGQRQVNGDLWRPEDENYYVAAQDANLGTASSGRWHYPANFENTAVSANSSKRSKKKKEKKDRWARTEDAYSVSEERQRRKSKKKKGKSSAAPDDSMYSQDGSVEFPEDAEGGLYGERATETGDTGQPKKTGDDVFSHEF